MPDTDVFRLQNSDLNTFLYADVGTESNGMPLSVVSMLGRLGGDPWADAGRLSRQPREAATRELAEIITGAARSERSSAEILAIATRLAALLPSGSSRRAPAAAAAGRAAAGGPTRIPRLPALGIHLSVSSLTWGAIIITGMLLLARMLGII
jgi:hypothetical protein